MKLSEMTNEQKSRWLAEKFEPMPEREAISGRFSRSALKFWGGTEDGKWIARDFVNDPAMTLMLITKITETDNARLVIAKDRVTLFVGEPWDKRAPMGIEFKGPLGPAVVDASMLQMGWKEE